MSSGQPVMRPQVLRPAPVSGASTVTIGVRERRDDDQLETELDLMQRLFKTSTPMLVSAIVHMVLLIILGLWMFQETFRTEIELVAYSDGEEEVFDSIAALASPFPDATQLESVPIMTTVAKTDPFQQTAVPVDPFGDQPAPTVNLEGAMSGRTEQAQNYMVGKRGGSKASQSAVGNGLKWLADTQDKRGYWKLQGHDRKGNADLVINENLQAATAMALLAFQGAGHTHRSGKYAPNVAKGMNFLLSNQTSDGNFCSRGVARDEMLYAHAQCTIVVCELLAMTKDPKLKDVAQDAVKFCIDSQDLDEVNGGGWRYTPGRESDTSVTGWMLVALKSATYAGIDVPSEVFNRVSSFLDKVANEPDFKVTAGGKEFVCPPGVLYKYVPEKTPDRVMSAEGMLMRQYLGWKQDDPRLQMTSDILLTGHLPTWEERDMYYWYYATQMFSHLDGEPWQKWNAAMRDMLVQKQLRENPGKGSWNPLGTGPNQLNGADFWCANGAGGRHYVTCLSLYVLEVYYRHLPIYQIKGRENTAR
ncbi:MAG: terpene cyclase/mutase family protein [Planctomycetaceae bacterium]|nr:terpene cyclase/mutase family protein [Planctomycetaceae bacterium]